MRKWIPIALAVLVVILAAGFFGGKAWLARSVMPYDGAVALPGLSAPVEVTIDSLGVPQIWAANDGDLYQTLGWLHAGERLFQMELVRRLSAGTLAELFGPAALPMDKQQRRIGFGRMGAGALADLGDRERAVLERYVVGINERIAAAPVLPPEFVLLGVDPAPWTVEHCLVIGAYQTWYSHALMDLDRRYQSLLDTLGDSLGTVLEAPMPWSPPTVSDAVVHSLFSAGPFPLRMGNASNSWAVAPSRSASGRALHASDPHLEVHRVPGFWYIAGLHSDRTDVLGVTAPGLPNVVMGHNGRAAWSFTVASVDIVDYYRFERLPDDTLRIRTRDGDRPFGVIEESIAVKGRAEPVVLPVWTTPEGPVVSVDSGAVVALRWAGYDRSLADLIASGLALHDVADFETFRALVTRLGALDVNWIYSDRDGTIGYQLGTPIPIRDFGQTFRELPGADPAFRWQGYAPLERTPHAVNPPAGWLGSCNNRIVSEAWPEPLPGFYDPYRFTMLSDAFAGAGRVDGEWMAARQLDLRSGIALRWKSLMAEGAARAGRNGLAADLREWNGGMGPDSREAALFRIWWDEMARAAFSDDLGAEAWRPAGAILEAVLSASPEGVLDRRDSEAVVEDRVALAAMAVERAAAALDTLGATYGEISVLEIAHPLSQAPMVDALLNLDRGPFPAGGDRGALDANFNRWVGERGRYEQAVGPSMRFVLDWADVDGFTINGNLGQSGNPFSPHYDDHLPFMREGRRWTVPFSRDAVDAKRAGVVVFGPRGG